MEKVSSKGKTNCTFHEVIWIEVRAVTFIKEFTLCTQFSTVDIIFCTNTDENVLWYLDFFGFCLCLLFLFFSLDFSPSLAIFLFLSRFFHIFLLLFRFFIPPHISIFGLVSFKFTFATSILLYTPYVTLVFKMWFWWLASDDLIFGLRPWTLSMTPSHGMASSHKPNHQTLNIQIICLIRSINDFKPNCS